MKVIETGMNVYIVTEISLPNFGDLSSKVWEKQEFQSSGWSWYPQLIIAIGLSSPHSMLLSSLSLQLLFRYYPFRYHPSCVVIKALFHAYLRISGSVCVCTIWYLQLIVRHGCIPKWYGWCLHEATGWVAMAATKFRDKSRVPCSVAGISYSPQYQP